MGLDDSIKNKAEELKGSATEAVGKLTGDGKMQGEGMVDKLSGAAKEFGNQASEKLEDAKDFVEGAAAAAKEKITGEK